MLTGQSSLSDSSVMYQSMLQYCSLQSSLTVAALFSVTGLHPCVQVTLEDNKDHLNFKLSVAGSVITGLKYTVLCSNSCLSRDDSDAYEFRFLHIVVSNVYHAETVCNVLVRLWKAAFSNHVCRSLRVVLAFARMLC